VTVLDEDQRKFVIFLVNFRHQRGVQDSEENSEELILGRELIASVFSH